MHESYREALRPGVEKEWLVVQIVVYIMVITVEKNPLIILYSDSIIVLLDLVSTLQAARSRQGS